MPASAMTGTFARKRPRLWNNTYVTGTICQGDVSTDISLPAHLHVLRQGRKHAAKHYTARQFFYMMEQ